jgi:uncharacterized protein (DUF885 family)
MLRPFHAPLARLVLCLSIYSSYGPAAAAAPAATPDAATPVAPASAAADLHELFDAEWERGLRENPTRATTEGDRRYDARWPDKSPSALEQSHRADQAVLARLARFAPTDLSAADRLNLELFQRLYESEVAAYLYGEQYVPLTQREGLASAHQLAELIVFRSAADYDAWLQRMRTFDTQVDQEIALLRLGLERGLVQPKVIIQRVPAQIEKQIVSDPTASPFYTAFRDLPAAVPGAEQERLRATAREVISATIVPAFARFRDFVVREYLPRCRETVGLWDTPGGTQWYQNRIRWFTTTELTADEVHAIGLREVARIRGEMQKVISSTGFKGEFAEFLQFLRTAPQFRHRDPQQLLQAYRAMAKQIDPMLPQYFGRLPRMPYGVRPIADQIAPDTTTAYYQAPAPDGSRAGLYYVNLYKPEERPTYEIPVLTIHEAVPGHHLQIALAQELTDLPKFRRDLEATAFIEGWALYSESLGEEMGLYADPYDKFGQLTYEMWRAVRLVIDTGIHHKRWSRQQAIDYFKANAGKTELDIINEVDRYIATPGQALAYKIGELRIKELRRDAAQALGARFDLRAFHDTVLGSGPLPLDVLSANVRRWLAERTAAAAAPTQ